jgi:hypothetical protein
MLAGFAHDSEPTRKSTVTWCGAHIKQRKSALYWVLHSKGHLEVFLRCEDTPEIRDQIIELLPEGIKLGARPYPRSANWAKSTPLFFFVRTEQQASDLRPLLQLLSSTRFDPGRNNRREVGKNWITNSEVVAARSEAAEEGATISVLINRYERNRKNRKLCLKAHGTLCSVCKFDFLAVYGEVGRGYIHVHHLKPLKALGGKSQKIDPINDLRPVCPNCHEMLHQCDPPHTIEQLRTIMASARDEISGMREAGSEA